MSVKSIKGSSIAPLSSGAAIDRTEGSKAPSQNSTAFVNGGAPKAPKSSVAGNSLYNTREARTPAEYAMMVANDPERLARDFIAATLDGTLSNQFLNA